MPIQAWDTSSVNGLERGTDALEVVSGVNFVYYFLKFAILEGVAESVFFTENFYFALTIKSMTLLSSCSYWAYLAGPNMVSSFTNRTWKSSVRVGSVALSLPPRAFPKIIFSRRAWETQQGIHGPVSLSDSRPKSRNLPVALASKGRPFMVDVFGVGIVKTPCRSPDTRSVSASSGFNQGLHGLSTTRNLCDRKEMVFHGR